MQLSTPRLVVAGLAGDSGKTLVALGLVRALASRGLRVRPFKKGPDYIDAAWLGAAAGSAGRNLDTFLMDPRAIGDGLARAIPADLLLVEGNRGLFDGLDAQAMRKECDRQRQKGAAAMMIGSVDGEKVLLVAMVSEALAGAGTLKAGAWVKAVAKLVGGGGGGKDTMAQAGGKKPEKLDRALEAAGEWAREQLS